MAKQELTVTQPDSADLHMDEVVLDTHKDSGTSDNNPHPIRMCVITYDWYPYEVRALRITEAAARAGNKVDVICLREPNKKNFEIHNGVRIYRMPLGRGIRPSLPVTILLWCWFLILAGLMVSWLHIRRHYQLVHVHNMPDFLVFSALIPKIFGAKVILDVQDVSPELMAAKASGRQRRVVTRLATFQEFISTRFADHVVTTGEIFAGLLIKRGLPSVKITNILNSADPTIFPLERRCPAPYDTPAEGQPFIVMYHGTIAARNGLDVAIRAMAEALKVVPNLRLDIQGGGEHMPILKQLAADLGISDHVRFTPSVHTDKLVDFVVHGDVGIIPYHSDGFMDLILPTKAYEFAWMQRPIIASDTLAMRSMFRPESVILCPPDDYAAFAAAIVDLYQRPERRKTLVTNALEDYTPYQWENMAQSYQALLASLVQPQKQLKRP